MYNFGLCMYNRLQTFARSGKNSLFLWGARQTGKSTLISKFFPDALMLDLLKSEVYQSLLLRPNSLREIVRASHSKTVVLDEIQKLPILLNEVHSLIENDTIRFILSGSSPRKIMRNNQNLLGGRALRYELYPLSFAEIPDFNLNRAINYGLLPRHYLSDDPEVLISNYINSYLEDEIYAEARIRNLSVFATFLHKAAFSNGDTVNYSNIATDCGVSSPTVKEYFQILEDTMIGKYIHPFQKRPKRQVISTPKFYFFDVGVVNHLLKRKNVVFGTELMGHAFEHLIYMELNAHSHYTQKNYPITFWKTKTKMEVDFILGDHEIAIEVKSTSQIQNKHLKNLKAFKEEYLVKYAIVVCNEVFPRLVDGGILILPWNEFLSRLWKGEIV